MLHNVWVLWRDRKGGRGAKRRGVVNRVGGGRTVGGGRIWMEVWLSRIDIKVPRKSFPPHHSAAKHKGNDGTFSELLCCAASPRRISGWRADGRGTDTGLFSVHRHHQHLHWCHHRPCHRAGRQHHRSHNAGYHHVWRQTVTQWKWQRRRKTKEQRGWQAR